MRKILPASIFVLAFGALAFGQDSNCPAFSVYGPSSVPRPNETMTFSVSFDEEAKDLKIEYIWSVDKGKIIEGQGTELITVMADSDPSTTATVEIKGLPEGCPNTASEMMMGHLPPQPELIDELLTSDSKIDSAKFDKIANALKDNSVSAVYIFIYTDEKTTPKKLKQKQQQIINSIREKNIPPERIVIVRGGEGKDLIRLWLVPPGAEPPTP